MRIDIKVKSDDWNTYTRDRLSFYIDDEYDDITICLTSDNSTWNNEPSERNITISLNEFKKLAKFVLAS